MRRCSNDYENLITSCFDCNRGKSGNEIDDLDTDTVASMKLEQIAQLAAFNKMLMESIEQRDAEHAWLRKRVSETLGWQDLSESESKSLRVLSGKLSIDKICEAADVTASKRISGPSSRWRYFCGVCWRMVKGD